MIEPVERFVQLPGLRMHYAVAGPEAGRPIILLHGFPEFWYSWRFQIPALVQAGFRVYMPDQRGYNLTDKHGPYDVGTLTLDIAQFQDALGIARCPIAGHDWGAVVAWAFAARFPERVEKLVVMNGPHPNAYLDACRRHFAQIRKSWYIYFFQLPWLPERMIRRNDFAVLNRVFRALRMSPEDVQRYKAALSQLGALTAMIGWYRAMVRGLVRSRFAAPHARITAPTCVIWGERDVALDRACNETLPHYVDDLRIHYLPNANHWVQMHRPDEVNSLLLSFLAPEGN
ncbi:MAG: alpha/beta fold hydrolase [Candidatus Hydrogenedentes bacterium]|nr:alpha/beta fold hydrolase [Candidatus Hydrogenedentota bacterium]